jgi:hypothetical protein
VCISAAVSVFACECASLSVTVSAHEYVRMRACARARGARARERESIYTEMLTYTVGRKEAQCRDGSRDYLHRFAAVGGGEREVRRKSYRWGGAPRQILYFLASKTRRGGGSASVFVLSTTLIELGGRGLRVRICTYSQVKQEHLY